MICHYRGFTYNIGDDLIRIFDTRGYEVGQVKLNQKLNHLSAQKFIDKAIDKKPKVKIGLFETEPYLWDVYENGKKYLGSIRQEKNGKYKCFRADDAYKIFIGSSVKDIMGYYRKIAKELK